MLWRNGIPAHPGMSSMRLCSRVPSFTRTVICMLRMSREWANLRDRGRGGSSVIGRAGAWPRLHRLAVGHPSRKAPGRYSSTVRQHASLRNVIAAIPIAAIPEAEWTPIPYWMAGVADVAETEYTPFESKPDTVSVRLIIRKVKPTPCSQLALFTTYGYHACITNRAGDTLDLEADHRRHAEIANGIRDLKYGVGLNHLPSGRFPANAAWLAVQVMAYNLARWTARIGLGGPVATARTLRQRCCSLPGRITRKARRLTRRRTQGGPGKTSSAPPGPDCAPSPSLPDAIHGLCLSTRLPNRLPDLRQAGRSVTPAPISPMISPVAAAAARQKSPSPR